MALPDDDEAGRMSGEQARELEGHAASRSGAVLVPAHRDPSDDDIVAPENDLLPKTTMLGLGGDADEATEAVSGEIERPARPSQPHGPMSLRGEPLWPLERARGRTWRAPGRAQRQSGDCRIRREWPHADR